MHAGFVNRTRNTRTASRLRRGFTLIELMVVIVIIGILGGTAIVFFSGATDEAKVARAQAEISSIKDACINYKVHFPTYPDSLEELESGLNIKVRKTDPWDNPYEYRREENGFSLRSGGAKPGEEDDIWWDPVEETVHAPNPSGKNNK